MRSAGVVAMMCSACSFTPGVLADVRELDAAAPDALDPATGWSTPVELTALSDPGGADDPSLTADLLEIYFGSRRVGNMSGAEDIWVAKRLSSTEPFGAPTNVTELNSISSETTMKVTGDGLTMYFASTRATGNVDLFVSTRTNRDVQWGNPVRIAELSSTSPDYAAFGQSNGLRLVFCRGIGAGEALYTSRRDTTMDMWSAPDRIDELDVTATRECDPVEPHPRALYFSTDYLNADGTLDIYRAARPTEADPYGSRTAISLINLPGINDRDPWVSPDERTMVFASDRNGVTEQLYISTR